MKNNNNNNIIVIIIITSNKFKIIWYINEQKYSHILYNLFRIGSIFFLILKELIYK